MPSLAEKINRLIRLSASSNQNEARNAAFQACRLLRENNIYLKESNHQRKANAKKDAPMKQVKVTMRVCKNEEQAKAVMEDHERAGYKMSEDKSVNETIRNSKQTIVLERGDRQIHIQLED